MIKKLCMLASACLLILPAAACVSGEGSKGLTKGTAMNTAFYNPLRIEAQMGDPWLTYHEGYYYYTCSEGAQIRVTKSPWMTNLVRKAGDETQTKTIKRQQQMGVVEIWAPEVFFFEGYWYVYFTATLDGDTDAKDAGRRTYGIKSRTADAMGEWGDAVEIELPMDYRSIDATFMDYGGRQYIVWSGWPNAVNGTGAEAYLQCLYITELETGNPLKAKSLEPAARVELSRPDYDWEKFNSPQNEGPAVAYAPETGNPSVLYAASYSGGDNYCIGYLEFTGGDILQKSGWRKGEKPLMQTDMDYSEVIAPGHCSVTRSPDGKETWIMYHAAKKSGAGWDRMARLQKMTWAGNTPTVERIDRLTAEVPLPSGETVNRVRYEAEDADLTANCEKIEFSEYDGGRKLFDYASGGYAINLGGEDDKITFNFDVPENGDYLIYLRYSNFQGASTVIAAEVNGEAVSVYAPLTNFNDSFSTTGFYATCYKRPDKPNTLTVKADKAVYIDCVIVDRLGR
ncbi:MAG: family 43 glycosylhydrolase [Clostridiales bacterium]|jgi:GH43 family beta-xylosidase|nr:family 43 glycosylhydrolase [Clostridiales bacterium]